MLVYVHKRNIAKGKDGEEYENISVRNIEKLYPAIEEGRLIKKPIPYPKSTQILKDTYVKMFDAVISKEWDDIRESPEGDHIWILRNPKELPFIGKPLENFAKHMYPNGPPKGSITGIKDNYVYPSSIWFGAGYWSIPEFCDAVKKEFGVGGVRLKDKTYTEDIGAMLFDPDAVDLFHFCDSLPLRYDIMEYINTGRIVNIEVNYKHYNSHSKLFTSNKFWRRIIKS